MIDNGQCVTIVYTDRAFLLVNHGDARQLDLRIESFELASDPTRRADFGKEIAQFLANAHRRGRLRQFILMGPPGPLKALTSALPPTVSKAVVASMETDFRDDDPARLPVLVAEKLQIQASSVAP